MKSGKYYVNVDCEGGACGVGTPGGTLTKSPSFEYVKLQMSREANAAVEALFDSGAERVILWDNHSNGVNLNYDLLDKRCEIALGRFINRFPGLEDDFSGVLLIGYHSMAGTANAVMAHTFSSMKFQSMKINNQVVGEIAVDSALAGEIGVPVLFISSDDKAVQEARNLMPNIESIITKYSYNWNAAISKHPTKVIEEIYQGVKQAVENRKKMSVFRFSKPIKLELRMKRIDQTDEFILHNKDWQRIDGYTIKKTLDHLNEFFKCAF